MREAIIIFTRVPIPGRTKTRLQGFLTKDQCAEIHKNFLKDIKKTCEKLNFFTNLGIFEKFCKKFFAHEDVLLSLHLK